MVLRLSDDAAVSAARSVHPWLLLMVHVEWDHACRLALPHFRAAADAWGAPGNVSFALVDAASAPRTVAALGASVERLPAYGLHLPNLVEPLPYRGGWSQDALLGWLGKQLIFESEPINSFHPCDSSLRIVRRIIRRIVRRSIPSIIPCSIPCIFPH